MTGTAAEGYTSSRQIRPKALCHIVNAETESFFKHPGRWSMSGPEAAS